MLKYDLESLDKLIYDTSQERNDELEKTVNQIKLTAFSLSSEEAIRLYIRNHQTALLEKKCYDKVCGNCDAILFFLETYFGSFVNPEMTISQLGLNKIKKSCEPIIEHFKPVLFEQLSPKLIKLIEPLFMEEGKNHFSINEARYISNFWKFGMMDFKSEHYPIEEEAVIDNLILNNFNPPSFFKCITKKIIEELHQEDNPFVQESVLVSHAKHINQIPMKLGNPFRHDFPHIKQALEEWTSIEIKQCRKRQKKYDPRQQTILSKEGYKIETSLSVAQTAYLFKLMNKSGVISNKVQMEVLHVISEKFRSKKTETISFDSLHNKYYNVEDKTKESVKEMLKGLLSQIE